MIAEGRLFVFGHTETVDGVFSKGRQWKQASADSTNPEAQKRVNPTSLTRRGFPHFGSEDPKHVATLAVEIESYSPFEFTTRKDAKKAVDNIRHQ